MSDEVIVQDLTFSKTSEGLKEDIFGIKTIIESLEQEAKKLENRRKQLAAEIRHNDNILNVIYEDISRDNKAFLAKLQSAKNPATPLQVSRNEGFMKRNFLKIKEGLEEKSVNLDLEVKKSTKEPTEHREGTTIKTVTDSRGEMTQRLDAENFYFFVKLNRGVVHGLPSDFRAIAALCNQQDPQTK